MLMPVGRCAHRFTVEEGFNVVGADDGFDSIGAGYQSYDSAEYRCAEKIGKTTPHSHTPVRF
jgi:hypothetical protein